MEVLSMAGLALALAGVGDQPPRVTVPRDVVTRGPLQDPPMVQVEVAGPFAVGDDITNTTTLEQLRVASVTTTTTSMAFANHPSKRDAMAVSHYGGAMFLRNERPMPDPGRRSIPPWASAKRRRR